MNLKSPHVIRLDDALTDVCTVQFTTTMAYDNLKYTDVYNSLF